MRRRSRIGSKLIGLALPALLMASGAQAGDRRVEALLELADRNDAKAL